MAGFVGAKIPAMSAWFQRLDKQFEIFLKEILRKILKNPEAPGGYMGSSEHSWKTIALIQPPHLHMKTPREVTCPGRSVS